MSRVHFNNKSYTLASAFSSVATSITLSASLPTISAGDALRLTLASGTNFEIIEITSNAGAPTYAVASRALESTTAQNWIIGDTVEIRLTANSVDGKEDTIGARAITTAAVATNDKVLIQDTSASDALRTVTTQAIADLAVGTGTEGTFTPVLTGSTIAGVGTYTTQRGLYFKMGNVCWIEIYLDWSAHTGTGTAWTITGLPFSARAGIALQTIAQDKAVNWTNGGTSYHYLEIPASSTVATMYAQSGTSSSGTILADAGAIIAFKGFYFV